MMENQIEKREREMKEKSRVPVKGYTRTTGGCYLNTVMSKGKRTCKLEWQLSANIMSLDAL